MGYFREIIAYQNPNDSKSQIVDLIKNLILNGWTLKYRTDLDLITYTLNAGDWITIHINEEKKLFKDLESLKLNSSFGGVELRNEKNDRIVWVYQYKNRYRFELQYSSYEDQTKLFQIFHTELKTSINKLEHILHVEWRTHYSNEIVRCSTNIYHEGVLILASSKKLKNHFSQNKFNYDFPIGLNDLLKSNSIIAVECRDYELTTIVEVDKFTTLNSNLRNYIEFEKEDELLIMNYADFSQICDNHKGNHKNYGLKTIIPIPIESKIKQEIFISRSGDEYDGEIIFQFNHKEKKSGINELINIEDIPLHNKPL